MGKYALEVKHVSKSFRLPTEQANGIKQAFVNWTKGIKGYKEQHVLKDISFKVEKGDFFGIVGRNGSGKSTLLKIISQIYTPEKGTVKVNGTLIPFIELGVGFNPELTGRENIYLNGALLGFSKDEVSAMYDEIVEFAELEEFMDQKLKNYSSGMQVRLAFSIAIKAQGDILVLDEVLAVGDEAFQRKCDDFFSKIKKDKTKTVILVTHSMSSVRRYCNKAIMINQGEVASLGSIDEVVEAYTQLNLEKLGKKEPETQEVLGLNDELTKLKINAISKKVVSNKENFEFEVEYNYIGKKKIFLAVAMFDQTRGGIVYDSSQVYVDRGDQKVRFSIPMELFNSSEFKLTASIRDANKKLSGNENLIGFTNDENSLIFKLSNKKEISDYALLNSEVFKVERIK
ncbi:MAG: ABC transporter ATP-binding protein [Candidatus Nanogingivalaceae bacterium]|jgi:ABC transporter related|nr:MAG: ABC transporter ATP-binding protein [Candidatus Nanogingivalaceae bacterium]QWB91568.1 MAG: ABC transporter ATP-binding protein [Candidatus Nanogingivalaceae bacterium]